MKPGAGPRYIANMQESSYFAQGLATQGSLIYLTTIWRQACSVYSLNMPAKLDFKC